MSGLRRRCGRAGRPATGPAARLAAGGALRRRQEVRTVEPRGRGADRWAAARMGAAQMGAAPPGARLRDRGCPGAGLEARSLGDLSRTVMSGNPDHSADRWDAGHGGDRTEDRGAGHRGAARHVGERRSAGHRGAAAPGPGRRVPGVRSAGSRAEDRSAGRQAVPRAVSPRNPTRPASVPLGPSTESFVRPAGRAAVAGSFRALRPAPALSVAGVLHGNSCGREFIAECVGARPIMGSPGVGPRLQERLRRRTQGEAGVR